ncbi:MAG: BON domain-containing protein [Chloroflexi bacterium]|nr:MAG: BON domain-containing protein [Chloroflexota bacterium]
MKRRLIGICLTAALLAVLTASGASADAKDSWITTKAKIALLTSDGFSVNGANVETIHGKVATGADKTRAEETVRQVGGVKSVKNLLQVVPEAEKKAVAASDSEIKDRVRASLKNDKRLEGVKVASVNNGLVLLAGKTRSLDEKLVAIESAYSVPGVRRVASEIETVDN